MTEKPKGKPRRKLIIYLSLLAGQVLLGYILAAIPGVETEDNWLQIISITALLFTVCLALFSSAKSVHKKYEYFGYFLYFIALLWGLFMAIGVIVLITLLP